MGIILQSSSGGSVTINEPTTASNLIATLPASTGTILTTGSPQPGGVIQVVFNSTSTQYTTTSGNTTLTLTNLNTTITPKFSTSKILIMLDLASCFNGSTSGFKMLMTRNGTNIFNPGANYECYQPSGGDSYARPHWTLFDSPATTSAVTYAPSLLTYVTNANTCGINAGGNFTSMMTLMEVAV